jgi:glutaconate CoA-transferase subunit B
MTHEADCTVAEIITVALARSFKDGEVGFTGLVTGGAAALYGTSIPLAAMSLAKEMHAPSLTILLAGWSHNPDLGSLAEMPDSEFDSALRDLDCEAKMITYPGPWGIKRGDIDFGFSSGVQVDRVGNLNSVCVGDYKRPKVRLVGPILLPEHMTLFGREYIMMPHHAKRSFVDRVDYVAGVGYPDGLKGREQLGLRGGGPEWVVTPKCIFDFDKTAGRIRLKSIHSEQDRDVQHVTGFEIGDAAAAELTPRPTPEELDLLRRRVDPKGILLGRHLSGSGHVSDTRNGP